MTFSMATVNTVGMFRLPSGNGHACEAGFASKCTSIVRLGAAFHNGCEVLCGGNATALREPLTVAPFQGLAKLLDCLAGDSLCLLDFHVCPPVSGAIAPFTGSRGGNTETGDKSGEMAASRWERVAGRMTPGFGGARRASEDRRRDELHAGTETARSGQRGEQAESQAKTEAALFGVRIARSFVGLRESGSG